MRSFFVVLYDFVLFQSVAASVNGCECAAALSSAQASCSSCSSPAQVNDSLQRIDSDEFFSHILV